MLENVQCSVCRKCKSLLHTQDDHKDICRGSVQAYSVCVWLQRLASRQKTNVTVMRFVQWTEMGGPNEWHLTRRTFLPTQFPTGSV
jgi:hypothetical protein